jgi:CheY-like chemotaxis protein
MNMTATRCVLVVEDETSAREVIVESLTDDGIPAVGATDGADAIRVLSGSEPPCVIILDLMMPGMNGWEFHEWLRAHPVLGAVPVILLSAVRGIEQEARRLGAAGWLAKPVSYEMLRSAIEVHCNGPSAPPAGP